MALRDAPLHGIPDILTERILDISPNRSLPVTQQHLTVVAESKEVRLPVDEVNLIAMVSPEDPEEQYQFDWVSLHQPEGSTAVKHQNSGELHLEKLTEGVYSFKVIKSKYCVCFNYLIVATLNFSITYRELLSIGAILSVMISIV